MINLTPEKGLSEKLIRDISAKKEEPEWMLQFRLKALETFLKKPVESWGPDLPGLDMQDI